MAENRSLDEFGVDAAAAADGDPDEDADPATPAEADPPATGDGIEPIAETFAWSAAGGECEECGTSVTTRWRDGERLVCEDCKAW